MTNNLAPIVIFTYNRLDHTRRTVEALLLNKLAANSDLYIYSDGPKNDQAIEAVKAVRSYLQTITGFKTIKIVARDKNWGLTDSIVDGVTQIVNDYGKIIVLEDDIVTSPYFLDFMNEALTLYENEPTVMHVSGYFYPVANTDLPETFFYAQTSCWGWGTWSRAWKFYNPDASLLLKKISESNRLREFDMDGKFRFSSTLRANIRGTIKTWAIKWQASVFLQDGLCLHPRYSFTQNIGHDGSGTNTGIDPNLLSQEINLSYQKLQPTRLIQNHLARSRSIDYLQRFKPTLLGRLKQVLKF